MTRLIALATEESVLLSVKLMWSSVSSVTSTTGSRGAAIGSRRDASTPCALSGPLYHPFSGAAATGGGDARVREGGVGREPRAPGRISVLDYS